jgi:hypothetical protein
MYKGILLAMLMLLVVTFECVAQHKLTPTNSLLGSLVIKPEKQVSTWYLWQDTTKRAMATITTTIQLDDQSDTILIIQEVAMKGASSPWVDSTIARKTTMSPIYHSSYNGQRDMVLRFSNDRVSGYYKNKQSQTTTQVDDQIKEPYFDSNLYPHLIRFLPLRTGYQAQLPIYDFNLNKHGLLSARVLSVTETILTDNGQQTPCYVVRVIDDISPGSQATYYVAKADRKLLKSKLLVGGRRMSIE